MSRMKSRPASAATGSVVIVFLVDLAALLPNSPPAVKPCVIAPSLQTPAIWRAPVPCNALAGTRAG